MLTQIINGKIHTPQGWLKNGSVIISDNKILEVSNCDLPVVGAKMVDARGISSRSTIASSNFISFFILF